MPLHGWHALALGVAVLHYALPGNVRDQKTSEPSTQLEGWLWRVPRDKDAEGRYWETPGRWFKPDGSPTDHVLILQELQRAFRAVAQQVRQLNLPEVED